MWKVICTIAVRHKSNKRKSLTQSIKKLPAAMRKQRELQIIDWGDISIENVAEQFLVESKEIENRDGPYTANDYIPTPNDIPVDLLHSFDQSKYNNYNQKEEDEKNEPKNEDDLSPKEKDGQNKEKMSRELYFLESYIKNGKSPSKIYKLNLVSLSRLIIFKRCKKIYHRIEWIRSYTIQFLFLRRSITESERNRSILW